MKKRILKIVGVLLILCIAAGAVYTALVLNPGALFKYERGDGQFTVLSSEPLKPGFDSIVKEALQIISESELYDPHAHMRIVLSHGHFYNDLSGMTDMAYSNGSNAILAGKYDIDSNSLYTDKSPVRMNLVSTLAHELAHCIQRKHHGIYTFENAVPYWKREGFAEYVSQRGTRTSGKYSLRESIGKLLKYRGRGPVKGWLTTEDGYHRPASYYRFRLMTEFLFDVKRYSYTEFMEDGTIRDDVYTQMISWYKTNAEQSSGEEFGTAASRLSLLPD